jgi:flagellar assembly protein FliH
MSTIIKGTQTTVATGQVQAVAFNFDDLAAKASDHLAQIRAQAESILAEARRRAQEIRAAAERDGREAAIRSANRVLDEKIGKQLESVLPALRKAATEMQGTLATWMNRWERDVIRLAIEIASKVIRREVRQDPEISLSLVREALHAIAGATDVVVRINPTDHAAMGIQVESMAKELSRIATTRVVADASIELGGCKVETQYGTWDQQFSEQLKRIEEELGD